MFTEFIDPCDDGKNCSNTKKTTIILLLDYQYRFKSNLRVMEFRLKEPKKGANKTI